MAITPHALRFVCLKYREDNPYGYLLNLSNFFYEQTLSSFGLGQRPDLWILPINDVDVDGTLYQNW